MQFSSTGLTCVNASLHAPDDRGNVKLPVSILDWRDATVAICDKLVGADDEFLVGIDGNLLVHESRLGTFGNILDPKPNNVDQRGAQV